MVVKKSKSNYDVNSLPGISTLNGPVDTNNFHIPKTLRLSLRLFQIVSAVFFLVIGGRINKEFLRQRSLAMVWFCGSLVGYFSIFCATGFMLYHFVPKIRDRWTSKRKMLIELGGDVSVCILYLIIFITFFSSGGCPIGGFNGQCDILNWTITWNVIVLSFWSFCLVSGLQTTLRGLYPEAINLSELRRRYR